MTHDTPAFTKRLANGYQTAVCGAACDPQNHSAEPDCLLCRVWLDGLAEVCPLPDPLAEFRERVCQTAIAQLQADRRLKGADRG